MLDTEKIQGQLKKIDFSDIRLLVVALILLMVPVFFFFRVASKPKKVDSTFQEGIRGGKGGFSFVQQSAVARQESPANLFVPPRVEEKWAAAIQGIYQAPAVPDLSSYDPETRMAVEAQYNPELRQANMFINAGQDETAAQILEKMLDVDPENPFLKFLASSKLVKIYERMGKKDLVEKENKRLMEIMKGVPKWGATVGFIQSGVQSLSQSSEMLDKARDDPRIRTYLLEMTQTGKIPQTPEMLQFKSKQILGNITSIADSHPVKSQGEE